MELEKLVTGIQEFRIGCQTKSITLYTEAERPKEIGEIINKILSYNGQLSCTLSAPKYR